MNLHWIYQQSADPILPDVTLDSWRAKDNQPLEFELFVVIVQDIIVSTAVGETPLETITLDKWYRDFEKSLHAPAPPPEGLIVVGDSPEIAIVVSPVDSWLPEANQPPRAARGVIWQQFLAIDGDYTFGPEVITLDKWYSDFKDIPSRAAARAVDFGLGLYIGEPIAPPPPPPPEPPFVKVWTEEAVTPDGWVEEGPIEC